MKRRWKSCLGVAMLIMSVFALHSHAVQPQKLRVVITSASGNSVYLDKGRADGLIEGLDVRFFPDSGGSVVGVIRAVSANSARVELPVGVEIPAIGTPGEAQTPAPAPSPEDAPAQQDLSKPALPDRPPWTRDLAA